MIIRFSNGRNPASGDIGERAPDTTHGGSSAVSFIRGHWHARAERGRLTARLGHELLERGVCVNLAVKGYISLAHSDEDLARTLDHFDASLAAIA
jgi:glutamate-1-semialdehyde aminotransferase